MTKRSKRTGNQRKYFTRLKQSILPVICLTVTLFWYGPGELYLSNRGSEEFWFSFSELILPLAVMTVSAVAALLMILMLLPEKGYHAGVALITGIGVLMLAQGLILPNGYGSLNGAAIDWGQYTGRMIYNTAIWAALTASAVFWAVRKREGFLLAARFAVCILLAVEAAILAALGLAQRPDVREETSGYVYLTTENEFTVSDKGNTIVFILDAFDSQLMCDLLDEYPEEIRTSFEDFTFFHNTSGGATRTKYAIPYILSGRTNDSGSSYSDYLRDSFESSPLIRELRTGRYDTGFYTEYAYVDRKQTEAMDNLSVGGELKATSQWGLTGSLMKMTAFKYAPHILKPVFWMYSMELIRWRSGIVGQRAYRLDDTEFYRELQENGLTLEQEEPAFRFYHLEGAHSPYTMNENIQRISQEEGTIGKQALGALRIVSAYIQRLKQLKAYDCTTVFVMADHGNREYVPNTCEQNPLMMVKTAEEHKPFSVSETRLSFRDLPLMLTDALRNALDVEGKYTAEGTRYFYIGITTNKTDTITEYASEGEAYDTTGYQATGNVYLSDGRIRP